MDFVIGDTHGEISKLKKLVAAILKIDINPRFIFIGDYLDKGENPFKLLLYLEKLALKFECIFLLGNHEYLWLNLDGNNPKEQELLFKIGAISTIQSFKCDTLLETKQAIISRFSNFFKSLKVHYESNNFVIVHSGLNPVYINQNINDIPVKEFLFNRYDFIKHQGLFFKDKRIIFGHTGFYFPFVDEFKIGIDTAACFIKKQPLTAFCTNLSLFVNSNGKSFTIDSIQKNQCPNIPRVKPWRYNDTL
jgi:serine/threonine protein phosphatase 1